MQPERYRELKQLFLDAIEREGADREAFLQERCASDPEALAEVRRMIEADESSGAAVDAHDPLAELETVAEASSVALPDRIDGFEIVQLVGRGGMGVVFEARQESPQRRVALKLVQAALASEDTKARFAREAELLGRLQHPGIAQVFTSGTWEAPSGPQPYLAMEFVEGISLTEFAKQRQLDDRSRVELIAAVADAVEHAHQRGVIHRDLKPANVLVTTDGAPKVLDFGVARALEVDAEAQQTLTGQVLGTPAYMSPEQASGEAGLVDARADVHALGVMLYELLTDALPRDLRGKGATESLLLLRDAPPRPLRSRRPDLRGDLDTILGKSIETEVSERYLTVAAFAADLRRFLADLPIQARPPSAVYQLRKFARRNRLVVSAAVGLVVVLVLGLAGTLYGLGRSLEERDEAQREARKAKTTLEFFQEMLEQARPDRNLGERVAVEDLLDESARRLEEEGSSEPEVEAALRHTIGSTYRALSRFDSAEEQLRRAVELRRRELGERHPDTADSLSELGFVFRADRRIDEARAVYEEALSIRREVLENPSRDLASTIDSLGVVARAADDLAAAEPLILEALAMRRALFEPPHESLAASLGHMGQLRNAQARYDEAETWLRDAFEMRKQLHGEFHPEVAVTANNLASLLHDRGRFEDAARMYQTALDTYEAVYRGDSLSTATTLNNLAMLEMARGNNDEAEKIHKRSLAMRGELLGEDSLSVAKSHSNLSVLYANTRRFELAKEHAEKSLAINLAKLPAGHRDILVSYSNLAASQHGLGDFEGAVVAFKEVLAQAEPEGVCDSWDAAAVRLNLGSTLLKVGRAEEALEFARPSYAWRLEKFGPRHPHTCLQASNIGNALRVAKRFEEAETMLLENFRNLEEAESMTPYVREQGLLALAWLYDDWEKPDDAKLWSDRAAAERAARAK